MTRFDPFFKLATLGLAATIATQAYLRSDHALAIEIQPRQHYAVPTQTAYQQSTGIHEPIIQDTQDLPPTDEADTVEARARALCLPDRQFHDYNMLTSIIARVAREKNVPDVDLAAICLAESKGHNTIRYHSQEAASKAANIDPIFTGHKPYHLKVTLDTMLARQVKDGTVTDVEQFKEQLSSGCGPWQVTYIKAIEYGFRGTAKELCEPETNARYAADILSSRESQHGWDSAKMAHCYNAGSLWRNKKERDGTVHKVATVPTANYVERFVQYHTMLERSR